MIHHICSLRDGGQLYLHTLGRAVRITAVATDVQSANDFCAQFTGQSVIAEIGDLVFLARKDDKGEKLPRANSI